MNNQVPFISVYRIFGEGWYIEYESPTMSQTKLGPYKHRPLQSKLLQIQDRVFNGQKTNVVVQD